MYDQTYDFCQINSTKWSLTKCEIIVNRPKIGMDDRNSTRCLNSNQSIAIDVLDSCHRHPTEVVKYELCETSMGLDLLNVKHLESMSNPVTHTRILDYENTIFIDNFGTLE